MSEIFSGSTNQSFVTLRTFFTRDAEITTGIAYLLMSIIGVIGNTFTILVMVFRRRLYNCCTPYLINVAVSDLLMTSLILPVAGFNAITGQVYSSQILCKWLSLVFHTITSTSWIGLAMVSAIRCMGIWTNNKCFLLKATKLLISAIWVIPSITIPYFLNTSWGSEEHIRTGYICWFFCGLEEMLKDDPEIPEEFRSDITFWLTLVFTIAPLATMIISYSLICHKVRKSKLAITSLGGKAFNKLKREVRFTRMIGIIFGNYVVCTIIPALVVMIRSSTPTKLIRNPTEADLEILSHSLVFPGDQWFFILFFTPFVTNPFIYVISNPFYRKTFIEFLQKCCFKRREAPNIPKYEVNLQMEERYN